MILIMFYFREWPWLLRKLKCAGVKLEKWSPVSFMACVVHVLDLVHMYMCINFLKSTRR